MPGAIVLSSPVAIWTIFHGSFFVVENRRGSVCAQGELVTGVGGGESWLGTVADRDVDIRTARRGTCEYRESARVVSRVSTRWPYPASSR